MNSVILRLGFFFFFAFFWTVFIIWGVLSMFQWTVSFRNKEGSITFSADPMTSELSVNVTHSPSDHFTSSSFQVRQSYYLVQCSLFLIASPFNTLGMSFSNHMLFGICFCLKDIYNHSFKNIYEQGGKKEKF